ncbi:hypothetical protein POM88_036221 [Heracleum sosnowskyi]|uniref:Uncharacterized protein n=1 Tax=Heracleum sosnowskyi TaxID=360622 RepID=A0AAD8MEU5_9APIA|nr:hypothetical protein POM88_036221 [Heracleum sosnowskyi]
MFGFTLPAIVQQQDGIELQNSAVLFSPKYSPFLIACYNPDLEEFQSVCRVMSGISDSFYTELQEAPTLGSFYPEKGELVLAQFKGDNEILPNLPHSCSEKTLP